MSKWWTCGLLASGTLVLAVMAAYLFYATKIRVPEKASAEVLRSRYAAQIELLRKCADARDKLLATDPSGAPTPETTALFDAPEIVSATLWTFVGPTGNRRGFTVKPGPTVSSGGWSIKTEPTPEGSVHILHADIGEIVEFSSQFVASDGKPTGFTIRFDLARLPEL